LLLSVTLSRGNASATEPPTYVLSVDKDAPALALSAAAVSVAVVRNELSPAWCAPLCNPESINALDRPVAGVYRPTWARVSDVGIAALLLAPPVVLLFDEGFPATLNDLVVVVEAIAWASAAASYSSLAVRRPRPFLYGTTAPLSERMSPNAALSFFSGHTATSFSAAAVLSETLFLRHPGLPGPWIAAGGTFGVAALVGTSRILAGQHFPTDVVAGALVGTSIGVLVPVLHEHHAYLAPIASDGARGFAIVGEW